MASEVVEKQRPATPLPDLSAAEIEHEQRDSSRSSDRGALAAGAFPRHPRFVEKGLLGAGGIGTVYRAGDRELGEDVALKVLNARGVEDAIRFKKEFRLLASLRHSHWIYVRELFQYAGALFFTMEVLDGADDFLAHQSRADLELRQYLPIAIYDEVVLRDILRQLLEACAALHAAHLVHRDIKPANCLVRRADRHLFLLDFGLVSKVHARSSEIAGTPAYIAPEVWRGARVTSAADMYAIGVMLYEILTGNVPFQGEAEDILAAHERGAEIARVKARAHHAPADLADLCMTLLAAEPTARPSAKEALAGLARAAPRR